MNKRHLHHTWTYVRRIKPWYFLTLAVVSGVLGVFALRANNEHMIKLRDAVYAADKANSPNLEASLQTLRVYVTSHMNTNLNAGPNPVYPPVQLKYTYDRLVQAESAKLNQGNSDLYTAAQHYCEQQNSTDFSGHNRVPCIEQYVQSHTSVAQIQASIPDALYKFAFYSPRWSPDLAGWSLVVAALSAVLFVVSFIADRWFRRAVA